VSVPDTPPSTNCGAVPSTFASGIRDGIAKRLAEYVARERSALALSGHPVVLIRVGFI